MVRLSLAFQWSLVGQVLNANIGVNKLPRFVFEYCKD